MSCRSGLVVSQLRSNGPLSTTYIRRPHGEPQGIAHDDPTGSNHGLDRMDRLFVSQDLEPFACESLFHEALDAGSDHAVVVADVAMAP